MFKRYVCVKQHDITDCGAAVLATLARHHGLRVNISKIRDIAGTDRKGTNLLGLVDAAEELGFVAKAVRGKWESLTHIPLPLVAHVKIKDLLHYVIIHKVKDKKVIIADPGEGMVKWSKEMFLKRWTGVLMLAVPKPEFTTKEGSQSPLSRIVKLMRPNIGTLCETFICALLFTVLGLGTSYYVQVLLDEVLVNQSTRLLNVLTIGMVLLILFRMVFGALRQYLLVHIGQKVDVALMVQYYRHILRLPMRFFDTRKVGEILSRLNDAVKIRRAISGTTLTIILDTTLVLVSIGVMFYYNWKLTLVALLVIPFMAIMFIGLHQPIKRNQRKIMEQAAELEGYLIESVTGVSTLKGFTAERSSFSKAETLFVRIIRSIFNIGIIGMTSQTLTTAIATFGILTILWYGSHQVINGHLTVGQLMFFYTLMGFMLGPIERLANVNLELQDALVAAERLGEVLDLEIEKNNESNKILPQDVKGHIQFKDVSFRYGKRKLVLQDINLEIPAGKTVALVGESGCGKTTLLKLIANFYDPEKGCILLDGNDIRDVSLDALRGNIGMVEQDCFMFHGTIRKNIALRNPSTSMEEVVAAAKIAGIHDFIMGLPQRYETLIGERGATLSGGQRQRIAIARAIVGDPKILLLDEATSHLDSASEKSIQKTMETVMGYRTTIVAAHRLSTIVKADIIVVMREERIAETGTHEELLERKGIYYFFWEQQVLPVLERAMLQTAIDENHAMKKEDLWDCAQEVMASQDEQSTKGFEHG